MLAVRVPVATLSVTAALPVPDAGESDSQAVVSLACQVRVPPPVLLMLRVCVAGLLPPCVAVKEKFVGLAPMAGGTGAAVMMKETGTVTVVAPGALRVIVAV